MDLLKPLIALLAIANPIGVVPFFIHFTQNFSRAERQRTMRISAFSAFVVIAVSALAGLKIIEFFGISIASFQVGGGMLLLISAMTMLNAQQAETAPSDVDEGNQKVDAGASIAVVPLTIPLLTGPATISTVVIYAEKTRFLWQLGLMVAYGVVIAVITFAALTASGRIARVLGRTGHQRHDAADGPDPGRHGRGAAGRRADEAVPGAGHGPGPLSRREAALRAILVRIPRLAVRNSAGKP